MGIGKQYFGAIRKYFKENIRKSNKKLLAAAVFLFTFSWAVAGPVRGVEQLILPQPDIQDVTIEQADQQSALDSHDCALSYLAAGTLASAAINTLSQPETEESEVYFDDSELMVLGEAAVITQSNPTTLISQQPRNTTISYVVQEGDTPSAIAAAHGITLNTLLWANDLSATTIIRPGDTLTVLPVSGIIHRVKSNETVGWIAKHYQGDVDEITVFNGLPADGTIQIGQKLVVPDGRMPIPVYKASPTTSSFAGAGTGKSRPFPYGQCTWYVSQKRYVPWSGHAKSWLVNAAAYGFPTGAAPQAGAIMVMSEGGWLGRLYGHVAYVESVNDGWVTISEMNYGCFACYNVRTIRTTDARIRGYIY